MASSLEKLTVPIQGNTDASIEDDRWIRWLYPIKSEPFPCNLIQELPTVALFVAGLLGIARYTRIWRK